MTVASDIADLSREISAPDLPGPELLPARLARACANVLAADGAGISVFSGFAQRVPLGASDNTATLAERLQFTTGQGPCLTAHATDQAVLATHVVMQHRWPVFTQELITRTPYRAILSLPMRGAGLSGDASLDLYFTDPDPAWPATSRTDAQDGADTVGTLLVQGAGLGAASQAGPVWLETELVTARALVWTAVGMITVALQLNAVDALARLRGYAYSNTSTVDDIAQGLTAGQIPVELLSA